MQLSLTYSKPNFTSTYLFGKHNQPLHTLQHHYLDNQIQDNSCKFYAYGYEVLKTKNLTMA